MTAGLPEPRTVIEAVELFLGITYPDGPPARIRSIFETLKSTEHDFYRNPPFTPSSDPAKPSYNIRLGSHLYQHTEFLIDSWQGGATWFFRVDTHDQHLLVARDNPEYDALCKLRNNNQILADSIESAWRNAGLPTYTTCFEEAARQSLGFTKEPTMPRQHSILVVDDETEVVKSLKNLLRLDYKVLGATGAAQAMEILASEHVDVIMTDQRMPEMTGVEMLGRVRGEHPDAIRLLFTGYADIHAVIDAINQGSVYRYITKPWDPNELQTIIREACEHHDLIVERNTLLKELRQKNAELKVSNELKSGFIKIASHEFRTPVTILMGLSKLALRDPSVVDPARDYVLRINETAVRLERLVNQTLSMLIAEKFDSAFDSRPEDLASVLMHAAEDIKPFTQLRNQQLEIEIGQLGIMSIDIDKLRDSLNHLLFNAVKFTPDNGRISLKAHRDGAGVVIEVCDTGSGIAPECMARLFEPFFTGFDVSRHSSGLYEYGARGLGLGLSVVKAFTEMHGGTVSVQSDLGKGTTFTLRLPDKSIAQTPLAAVA